MTVVRTVAGIREHLAGAGRVALVPTMGALHEGHLALIRAARRVGGPVVVSIFVNPTQFNDAADLAAYPRQEDADVALATAAGADVIFAPDAGVMYPPDHATVVSVQGPAAGFEGDARPGHFTGVATVCLKLLNIVQPAVVVFGQKDAQQVAVIRQIVGDLNVRVAVEVVPTVRDLDGLALSSRNARLSAEDRQRARALPRALAAALAAWRRGGDPLGAARECLTGLDVDYVDVASFDGERTLIVAVRVGGVRLIDNLPLDHPERAGLSVGPGDPS